MDIYLSYVYVIKCPKTGVVRYVGHTTCPATRFVQHINGSLNGNNKNKILSEWIKSLLSEGVRPVFEVVKLCLNENATMIEKSIYTRYAGSGMLLNQKSLYDDHSEIDYDLLKQIAKEKGLKQTQIAKACGLHPAAVGFLFRGKTKEVKIGRAKIVESYLISLMMPDIPNVKKKYIPAYLRNKL